MLLFHFYLQITIDFLLFLHENAHNGKYCKQKYVAKEGKLDFYTLYIARFLFGLAKISLYKLFYSYDKQNHDNVLKIFVLFNRIFKTGTLNHSDTHP